jgi:hypothetical protein
MQNSQRPKAARRNVCRDRIYTCIYFKPLFTTAAGIAAKAKFIRLEVKSDQSC